MFFIMMLTSFLTETQPDSNIPKPVKERLKSQSCQPMKWFNYPFAWWRWWTNLWEPSSYPQFPSHKFQEWHSCCFLRKMKTIFLPKRWGCQSTSSPFRCQNLQINLLNLSWFWFLFWTFHDDSWNKTETWLKAERGANAFGIMNNRNCFKFMRHTEADNDIQSVLTSWTCH